MFCHPFPVSTNLGCLGPGGLVLLLKRVMITLLVFTDSLKGKEREREREGGREGGEGREKREDSPLQLTLRSSSVRRLGGRGLQRNLQNFSRWVGFR